MQLLACTGLKNYLEELVESCGSGNPEMCCNKLMLGLPWSTWKGAQPFHQRLAFLGVLSLEKQLCQLLHAFFPIQNHSFIWYIFSAHVKSIRLCGFGILWSVVKDTQHGLCPLGIYCLVGGGGKINYLNLPWYQCHERNKQNSETENNRDFFIPGNQRRLLWEDDIWDKYVCGDLTVEKS